MGEKPLVIWRGERNLEKSPTRFPSFVQSARVMHFLFQRWDNRCPATTRRKEELIGGTSDEVENSGPDDDSCGDVHGGSGSCRAPVHCASRSAQASMDGPLRRRRRVATIVHRCMFHRVIIRTTTCRAQVTGCPVATTTNRAGKLVWNVVGSACTSSSSVCPRPESFRFDAYRRSGRPNVRSLAANALGCRVTKERHPVASVQLGRLFPMREELFQPVMLIIEFTFEFSNALSVTQFR